MLRNRPPSDGTSNDAAPVVRHGALGRIFVLLALLFALAGGSTMVASASTITFTAEELVGKPTDTSITINIVPGSAIEYYYEYDVDQVAPYAYKTGNVTAAAAQPSEVTITGLLPNTRYYYRMVYDGDGDVDDGDSEVRTEHSFMTARDPGSTFVFAVTSDTHYNLNSTFTTAMNNILADGPDFLVDLGDTFMVDGTSSQTAVNTRYLAFREPAYLDRIGHSVPVFLSSGNHEEEEGWNLDDTFSIGVASIQARKAFYPTPVDQGPGGFYSGNTDPLAAIDQATYGDKLREDYYAWEWGDALFVVIDPFQYTMDLPYTPAAGEGSDDPVTGNQWSWTLGEQQFNWFKQVIQGSNARYKFVFSHQMLGGINRTVSGVGAGYVRGGAEAAAYYEWGGKNADGTEGFATNRDAADFGSTPLHQFMADNGVSAYFHGHDHQYVYEKRGSIVYQEVPSPSMAGTGFTGIYTVGTYSEYETIVMQPSTGHLRVTVTPTQATVDYVRSNQTGVSYSYTIAPNIPVVTHDLTVNVSPAGAGTTSPSGTTARAEGSVVNVTATPNTGYAFSSWSGDCSGSTCSVTMDADKTVTANFTTVPTYVLTTAVSPEGAGTISPPTGPQNAGSVVNVTAAANTGWVFSGWSGACAGTDPCSFTMTEARSVTANFTPSATGVVTPDGAASSGTANSTNTVSFAHTTGTGADRLLLVGVSWNCGTTDRTISSVTFTPSGGSAVTLTPVITQQAGTQLRYSAIYRWPAGTALPSGQAGTVAVTFSGSVSNGIVAGAANFAGVDQATPLGTAAGAGSTSQGTAPTVTLTGLGGAELVFDNLFMGGSGETQTVTAGAGQSAPLWNAFIGNVRGAASTEQAAGSSVTMSWTAGTSAYWAIAAVPINPAAAGPTYNLTVAVSPAGAGTTVPAAGVHPYAQGTVVPVTAAPNTGWVFDHWSGACTGTDPCSVTMTGDKSVTAYFAPSTAGVVTPDGTASSGTGAPNASSVSFSHTTGTGSDRLMLVGVSWNCGSTDRTIASVTFTPSGGVAIPLTEVITQQYYWTGSPSTDNYRYTAIYRLLAPAGGTTGTVNITFSGAVTNGIIAGAANFAGVDQTTPLGTPNGAVGTGTSSSGTPNPAVTLTGLAGNELVFDSVFLGASSTSHTMVADAGQSELWNVLGYTSSSSFNARGAASTKPATGASANMSWTTGGYGTTATRWAIAAVPINPAPVYAIAVTIGKTGDHPTLNWAHTAASADHYAVYRSLSDPYFAMGPGSWLADVPTATPTFTDLTADLTAGGSTFFYLVAPMNASGVPIGSSNRTGVFVYGITPGD